jgi:hypothetical protein
MCTAWLNTRAVLAPLEPLRQKVRAQTAGLELR